MFEGFQTHHVELEDVSIHCRKGGSGPPLLLIHGYPQTHVMWHKIAPRLARQFTVLCPDLRGYGDSSKPPTDELHETYSKRAMALDMLRLMARFGHKTFAVAGHDRGGRVARRLCLDHPNNVTSAAFLDIVPTTTMFDTVTPKTAFGYYHWYFLSQPNPLPETLIGADPNYYLQTKLGHWSANDDEHVFWPEAMAEYQRCFSKQAAIRGSCEDYRAAISIDLDHDRADADKPISCPILVLWGANGLVGREFNVLSIWEKQGQNVSGSAIECGHFLAEEAPDETFSHLEQFFQQHAGYMEE